MGLSICIPWVLGVFFSSANVLVCELPTVLTCLTSFFGTFNFVTNIIKMKGENGMSKIMWLTTGVSAQVLIKCICFILNTKFMNLNPKL